MWQGKTTISKRAASWSVCTLRGRHFVATPDAPPTTTQNSPTSPAASTEQQTVPDKHTCVEPRPLHALARRTMTTSFFCNHTASSVRCKLYLHTATVDNTDVSRRLCTRWRTSYSLSPTLVTLPVGPRVWADPAPLVQTLDMHVTHGANAAAWAEELTGLLAACKHNHLCVHRVDVCHRQLPPTMANPTHLLLLIFFAVAAVV